MGLKLDSQSINNIIISSACYGTSNDINHITLTMLMSQWRR